MMVRKEETVLCQICGKQKRASVSVLGELVRPSIVSHIVKDRPNWSPTEYICYSDLNIYRGKHLRSLLEKEKGELSILDNEVINSLVEHELLTTKDKMKDYEENLSFGDDLADKMADFGGSWSFIIIFMVIIICWLIVNATTLIIQPYDPYPFILLNTILSCLAAFQAPIILMSQNRQEERDRQRAQEDYKINLKAELEIRHLSEKMDHIHAKQWERLNEIHQIQMELMKDNAQQIGKSEKKD